MGEMKYIVLKTDDKDIPDDNKNVVVIFNSAIFHRITADRIRDACAVAEDGGWYKPITAGFCGKNESNTWSVWGHSETLKLRNDKNDNKLLNDFREFIEFGQKYSVMIKGLTPGAIAHIREQRYFSDERIRIN